MKKINNMSDLEKKAIKVINGMLVVWPQSNKTERLEIMGMVPTLNGCYAVNNATVCWMNHDEAFVIPYMKEVMEVFFKTTALLKSTSMFHSAIGITLSLNRRHGKIFGEKQKNHGAMPL